MTIKAARRDRLARRAGRLIGAFSGTLKRNVCFVHIPKCAGNSIGTALVNSTPLTAQHGWIHVVESRAAAAEAYEGSDDQLRYHEDGDLCERTFAIRERMARDHFARGTRVISGHILFNPAWKAEWNDYAFVTVLREPVERMISHYAEEVSSGVIDLPFGDYLDTAMARRHANTLTRYIAGEADLQAPSEEATARAKQNLALFDLVGTTERTGAFTAALGHLLGTRIRAGHRRRAVMPKPEIDAGLRRRVEEMCAGDAELYAHAVETCTV